jgi:hypothetical protein
VFWKGVIGMLAAIFVSGIGIDVFVGARCWVCFVDAAIVYLFMTFRCFFHCPVVEDWVCKAIRYVL